jgi:PPOX class probable F420-dependent enzyme
MRLDETDCRVRFASARHAILATCGQDRRPHLVPVTFSVDGDLVVVAVDQKPKTTVHLRRLRNIAENPHIAFLADHYAEDWSRLWWVRADAVAEVVTGGARREDAIGRLVARYPQYAADPPAGPVILASVTRWSGWAGSSDA